jgi:hypothetical protein
MYKDEYIQSLFDYYHEPRADEGPAAVETPLVPVWKPEDDSPEHATFADEDVVASASALSKQHYPAAACFKHM